MFRRVVALAAVTALVASSAHAAVLTDVEGAVVVNRGNGPAPAGNGTPVAPGDRVRTTNGSVEIVYENGCTVKVGPNELVTVLPAPPQCGPGGTLVLGGLALAGIGLGVALANNSPASP